jgi:SAM-dependent methyltransferase
MSSLDSIRDYYERRLRKYGATPRGVDWNGAVGQRIRFEELTKLVRASANESFSVDDYGCGYGAYVDYLEMRGFSGADYLGLDVSPDMVSEARRMHPKRKFDVGVLSPRTADYAVASGIFNVALQADRDDWLGYIIGTLDSMDRATVRGFAFNCLTSYADPEFMRSHLYYGSPCFFFDYCKRNYSSQVALQHDYGLFEFTVIVRKDA